jgi:hypothetical protein
MAWFSDSCRLEDNSDPTIGLQFNGAGIALTRNPVVIGGTVAGMGGGMVLKAANC